MEVKLRKYRNNMVTSGWATVVLCLWEIVKLVMSMLLETTYKLELVEIFHTDDQLLYVLEIVFFIIVMGLFVFLQVSAGLGGVLEGKGGKRKNGYLVCCVLMFLISIWSIYSSVKEIKTFSLDVTVASIILDTTAAVALGDLFISAMISRHLVRKIEEARV